jgi:hypothetical protein
MSKQKSLVFNVNPFAIRLYEKTVRVTGVVCVVRGGFFGFYIGYFFTRG